MESLYTKLFHSPIGPLLMAVDEEGSLRYLTFYSGNEEKGLLKNFSITPDEEGFEEIEDQLDRYFKGSLKDFAVKTKAIGTDFQERVWSQLKKIPYGKAISYGELARRIGDIKAVRAVGHANNQNPISIIIPCHRVIGANGDLVGYGGGMDNKKFLLAHEGIITGSLFQGNQNSKIL